MPDGDSAYEMQTRNGPEASRQRSASGSHTDTPFGKGTASALRQDEFGSSMKRSNTTGRRMGEGLKKKFGSLRRGKGKTADA